MDMRRQFSSDYAERYRIAAIAYARADGEALRLEKLSKRVFSSIVHHLDGAVAAREHAARTSVKFTDVEDQWITAQTNANTLKAEVEAIKIEFEEFRTHSATARNEMRM